MQLNPSSLIGHKISRFWRSESKFITPARIVAKRIDSSKNNMAEERFALMFWIEDAQYSVVEREDIIGEVEVNKTAPVAWQTKKRGTQSVVRNWYEATILKLSGKS